MHGDKVRGLQILHKAGYTDMRKGPTGLAYLVQYEMGLEPFGKSVFLFCGRSQRTVKAIVWDRNGWLCLSALLYIHAPCAKCPTFCPGPLCPFSLD